MWIPCQFYTILGDSFFNSLPFYHRMKLYYISAFIWILLCSHRAIADNGLAPEVTDLNARDISFEKEREMPYLTQPFISSHPENKNDQLPVGALGKQSEKEKGVLLYAKELANPSENPKNGKTDSLLIAHRGKLVFESYFRRGRANFPHYQMSITKSYTALAVGRAIQLGYLSMKDLDKAVVHFLNDIKSSLLTPGAEQITLHQAMHMTSGIRMSNKNIEEIILQPKLLLGQGHIQAYLQFSAPISPHPRPYKYQPSDPSITMQVLESVVPGSAKMFINDELLRPMGISNYGWQEDVSGFPKAAAGASLLSRDMIKMGLLVMQGGKWNDEQFIPEDFLQKATAPLVQTNEENFYGYFWWSQVREINGKKYPSVQGRGAGGQFIFIFPSVDLVVVTTAHNQGMGTMLNELPEKMIPLFN